jgi:RNA polymerase sigma-70 factor, ECF subfamily
MVDSEDEILKRARGGDQAAFGKLVDRYYEMVYAVAFGVLRNRESARDVAQEAFIKAHRELPRFEGKSKFKTWVYRITVNAAIDEQRKRKRPVESLDATDASDDDSAPVIITDPSPDPSERAEQSELRTLIFKALDHLSPDHRAVLVLREYQGLSYEEIAETLGIEMGTVMSRLFYARKKMAEVLAPKLEMKRHS